ncbi:integrase [Mucilaginibacter sp. UYP25]|uniref:tyrosine-type recombinase/integrase n=1 Tax=unclassified Mucilaginibacter TaxID=2617802 RepID=UPI003394C988
MSLTQLDFTEPTIVTSNDLNHRSYIAFNLNGKPIRQYHGKCLQLQINPNRAKSLSEKTLLLNKLLFALHKALEAGTYGDPIHSQLNLPNISKVTTIPFTKNIPKATALQLLFSAVKLKLRSDLSKKYKRNLKAIYRQFRNFMTIEEQNASLLSISTLRVETFLSAYSSSGTYYMNKRRDLGVLFTCAGRGFEQSVGTIKKSSKKKSKATLHKAYDKSQVKPILNFLEINYPNLYLCCLLTYSSWLRPHEEVRLLTVEDFKRDWTEVHLSGDDNKGGNVRVVYIPDYAREALLPILSKLSRKDNIFSRNSNPLNEYYFNTSWSRAYKKMFSLGLIFENQTIYSFRHTAAIEVYRKTKDVYLLQKLLGHSNIIVTLKYLRSLGEFNSEELRDSAPTL